MRRTDRYQVLETIQEGMAAVTYKAHDRVLDRPVLLKVLHQRLVADPDLVQRFRREALLQARLKHPGIVTVYDFGTDEDFYIASEFITGQTLERKLREKGRLTLDELTPILQAVIHALAYAHREGVVHRDLKPANILIADSGEVKLTDFGLACARDMGELTQEGCVIGTPSYMSPEQARGLKVDVATDVFALGVIVYQALSGANPFAASNYADALSLVLNYDPRPLSELVRGLPTGLSEFVGRMLAKSPSARPGSVENLLHAFAATAQPPGRHERARRGAVAALVAPALVVAVVVPIVIALSRQAKHRIHVPTDSPSEAAVVVGPRPESAESVIPAADNTGAGRLAAYPITVTPAESGSRARSAPVAPLSECRLRISVTPWADVAIDGHPLGTTPLSTEPVVSPGRHVITLRNPYYPEVTRTVDLDRSACTLAFNLAREVAELDIRVTPWAVVAVDGRTIDTTPMAKPIPVALGNHEITLTHPELGVRHETIQAESARVYRITYELVSGQARNLLGTK